MTATYYYKNMQVDKTVDANESNQIWIIANKLAKKIILKPNMNDCN